MPDTSLFQDVESNKQSLTKASIREALLSETKFHLAWSAGVGVLLLPFTVLVLVMLIRDFYIWTLFLAALLASMEIIFICNTVQYIRDHSDLDRGAFFIKTDTLVSGKSVNHSQWISNHYHFHVENIFVFESGLRFVRNRVTPTQKDLLCDANVGDVFYLVILDHKPSKPRYIYNTKSFEYKER
jgi:hypothetical protein